MSGFPTYQEQLLIRELNPQVENCRIPDQSALATTESFVGPI